MTDAGRTPGRWLTRETRLLLITITISAVALLLLSRLRFPESPAVVTVPPVPLERLAARATFNELARIVAAFEQRVSGSLVVLRVAPESDTGPRALADVLRSAGPDEAFRHVPALRISETIAVAAVGPDARIIRLLDPPEADPAAGAELVAADPARQLALVRIPPVPPEDLRQVVLGDLEAPAYVVMVEGTRAGLAFRPVFVGSDDRFTDSRWSTPLVAVSSVALTSPGALVFSLEGQFLGYAVVEGGALAIAGARDLMATFERLSRGEAEPLVDPGIAVQPLTPALGETLGVPSGAVVAEVAVGGPAAGILEPADVVTGLDGHPVDSANDFLLQVARRGPGAKVELTLVRRGQPIRVFMTLPSGQSSDLEAVGGMALEPRPGMGSEVNAVMGGSAADRAALRVGDLIVGAGDAELPSPAQIRSLLEATEPDSYLLLHVNREGRVRILPIAGSSRTDDRR